MTNRSDYQLLTGHHSLVCIGVRVQEALPAKDITNRSVEKKRIFQKYAPESAEKLIIFCFPFDIFPALNNYLQVV